jgi:hypothetical protein
MYEEIIGANTFLERVEAVHRFVSSIMDEHDLSENAAESQLVFDSIDGIRKHLHAEMDSIVAGGRDLTTEEADAFLALVATLLKVNAREKQFVKARREFEALSVTGEVN